MRGNALVTFPFRLPAGGSGAGLKLVLGLASSSGFCLEEEIVPSPVSNAGLQVRFSNRPNTLCVVDSDGRPHPE